MYEKTLGTLKIYVSPKRRLELNTGNLINLSEGYTLENTAPEASLHLDEIKDRKLQHAMVKRNMMFSRISLEIENETYIICMNLTATESVWRFMQRLLNSFQLRQPATLRLKHKSTDAVLQYRPKEWMTNIAVDHLEMGSLTVTSVPVSVLNLLLHMFNRSFTAVCAPSVVVGRYQVHEFCRYRLTPKRLQLKNENQRIYIETLRDTLHS